MRLVPAWVDVREFLAASNRVRSARGARAVQLAYAALALYGVSCCPRTPTPSGPTRSVTRSGIATSACSTWSPRTQPRAARHDEALTALEAAAREDPDEPGRDAAIAEHLQALGRARAAAHIARRATPESEM